MVYIVVDAGETVFDPETLDAPKFEATTADAFVDDHSNWLLPPKEIDEGVAVSVTTGEFPPPPTVTVAVAVACLPLPLTVMV